MRWIMKKEKEYRLSEGEKVSYSFGDCAGQIYVTLATYFLTGYYTDTVGISALAVGTMMLVARVFDGTTDLVMGAVIDRTRSRHGKARAWILWTTPLMAVALVALFSVPSSMSGDGKLIYAYFTYILLNCIIYTANGIAYNSLLSRMTLNVQDRCSASSLRFVLGNLAAMTVVTMVYNIPTILGSLINPLLVAKMGKRKYLSSVLPRRSREESWWGQQGPALWSCWLALLFTDLLSVRFTRMCLQ